jgi:hypothetical protein
LSRWRSGRAAKRRRSHSSRAWREAKAEEHLLLTPEYAYLTDLKKRRADDDWKAVRAAKAASALRTLAKIAPSAGSARLGARSGAGATAGASLEE